MIDIIQVSKALSNKTRVEILNWLKFPAENFPPHKEVKGFKQGVCLIFIKEKANLSQSTISQYMSQLQKSDLVISTRIGKWTYFKRNESAISSYAELIKNSL